MAIVFTENIEILQRKVNDNNAVSRKIKMSATRTDTATGGSVINKDTIAWITGADVVAINNMAIELGNMILADIPEKTADNAVVVEYEGKLHDYLTVREDIQ
jgi:hypothetical protein